MRLDERAGNRKTETASLDPFRSCVAADELAEDLALELRGDSNAFVLNGDPHDAVITRPGHSNDSSVRRILDCVRE